MVSHSRGRFFRTAAWILFMVSVVLIASLDARITKIIPYYIIYLIPIAASGWLLGHAAVCVLSALATIGFYFANVNNLGSDVVWHALALVSLCMFVGLAVSLLREARLRLSKVSDVDYLTGKANLRSFLILAQSEMNHAQRSGTPFTVAYLDLDQFRQVNDAYGRSQSDVILCAFAETLQVQIRATDTVARVGEDEFSVFFPETGYEPIKIVVDKIQSALEKLRHRRKWQLTWSLAIVTFLKPPQTVDEIFQKTEALLQKVKAQGGNGILHEFSGGSIRTASL